LPALMPKRKTINKVKQIRGLKNDKTGISYQS
jgi:hypothetical protein